jgi:ribosomal protein S1
MTFLTFVADHPVGSTFDGTVVSFTSHGAHVDVGGMLCHVPLRGLADPPPKRARQVLTKGEARPFLLVSLDPARRRAELALPGIRA